MIAQAFSPHVDRFARAAAARLERSPLAVMLDIDGTLAPIAPTPDAAVIPPETRDVVRRLASLPDVHVALISGRSVADASRLANVDDAWIIGNHGLEQRTPDGDVSTAPEAGIYDDAVARAANALAPLARSAPGALLENKRWTLSLHYRLVDPDEIPPLLSHARDVARQLGLRVTEGKKIIELRPPIDINKGTAALEFAKRVGALDEGSLLYAGDDQTDEDAFRVLREGGRTAVTIRIVSVPEDQAAPTQAELMLGSPGELRAVLEWLLARRTR